MKTVFSAIVVCVIWAHLVVPRGAAGRLGREGLFLGRGDVSGEGDLGIDEGMVEHRWINCSLHSMNFDDFSLIKYIIRDSREIKRRARLLLEGNIEEATTPMSPEIKRKFIDCLNRQEFSLHGSDDDVIRNIFTEFIDALLGHWKLAPRKRRHLAYIAFKTMAPELSPSFALAPEFSRALSFSLVEAPAPSPEIYASSYSPGPSPVAAPVPAPAIVPSPSELFLGPSPESVYPREVVDTSPDSSSVKPDNKPENNGKQIVEAVVVTATVVSLLAAFLAFCCLRYARKKELEQGQKDDENFVVLNDLYGASKKFSGNGNVVGAASLKKNHSQGIKSSEAVPSEGGITEESVDINGSEGRLPLPPGMVPPSQQKVARPRPVPPPPPPNFKPSPQPPPPPKCASPPRPPPGARVYRPSPLGPKKAENAAPNQETSISTDPNAPKTKLKPFFWDKVQANNDQSMVWDQIKAGSFQFNEEMIESLFGVTSVEKQKSVGKKEASSKEHTIQYIQLIEPKKAQNLAISLKAMNVKTEEVCDALIEGNELPTELLQTLLRMVPSTDEELKLRLYTGDNALLGPAEQFLKAMVEIPFAFQRMDALLFMSSLQEDLLSTKESFATLEAACKELRSSRLFLKLLEAVLKTGNRMNDGTFRGDAQAFKLDTLLKLSDVKGTDGKTTLLHFVVQEIIRSEGVKAARARARESGSISKLNVDDLAEASTIDSGEYLFGLGLKVVSGVCTELENVKKAAGMDADALTSTVANLGQRLIKTKEFVDTSIQSIEGESGFHQSLLSFIEKSESDITDLLEEEKRIRSLVKSTTDYFHGSTTKDEGLRLFVIVRDFLGMIDKVCKEISELAKRAAARTPRGREAPNLSPLRDAPNVSPARDPRQLLFPAIRDQRIDCSSSDDDDDFH